MKDSELTVKLVGIGGPLPKIQSWEDRQTFILKVKQLSQEYNVNITVELPAQKDLRTSTSSADLIGYSIEPLKVADVIINEEGQVLASRRG